MKNLLAILVVMFIAISPLPSYAQDKKDARLILKKWGMTYCLSQYLEGPAAERDTGEALEALDIYESNSYQRLIRQQDKYLNL